MKKNILLIYYVEPIKEEPKKVTFASPNWSVAKHLAWIKNRLVHVHKENPNYDYIIKLQEIIEYMEENEKC
jgi:hypothetical protein